MCDKLKKLTTKDWTKKELSLLCKHEGIKCSGTKDEMCQRLMEQIGALNTYLPEKYLDGLKPKERIERIKEISKGKNTDSSDPKSYSQKKFKTDFDKKTGKRKKTKTSSYTEAFNQHFPNSKSLEEKAKSTGIPLDILEKVYKKGLAAWRTGHRPGATQEQWGYARVHSFIMKGCTYYSPDHKLVEEAKERSQKAKKWWKSIDKMCKKK